MRKSILATRQDSSEADSASNSARSADDLMLMKDDTRVDDDALMPCCSSCLVDDAPMTRADVKERRHRIGCYPSTML